jgi:hypothetical protein
MNRDPYTDKTAAKWPEPQEGPGLFSGRAVLFGGVLSLAIWAALYLILSGRLA